MRRQCVGGMARFPYRSARCNSIAKIKMQHLAVCEVDVRQLGNSSRFSEWGGRVNWTIDHALRPKTFANAMISSRKLAQFSAGLYGKSLSMQPADYRHPIDLAARNHELTLLAGVCIINRAELGQPEPHEFHGFALLPCKTRSSPCCGMPAAR